MNGPSRTLPAFSRSEKPRGRSLRERALHKFTVVVGYKAYRIIYKKRGCLETGVFV